jgi:MoaA/NifB/PqqE/SkfB family radical SAM enzyme
MTGVWTSRTPTFARYRKLARAGLSLGQAVSTRRMIAALAQRNGALLQIENTSYCNYHCDYCPTHSKQSTIAKVARGHMSTDQFRRCLDDNPRATLVVIQGQGEPLMDPTLFEKIAMVRERGMLSQVISNGSLLDAATIARLTSEGPDILLFSVDCLSAERSQLARKGMRYLDVLRGITALTAARRGTRQPVVGLLSIVHGAYDAEVEDALLRFNALGIDVLLYKPLNRSFEGRIKGYRGSGIDPVPAHVRRQLNYVISHQRLTTIAPCAQLKYRFPYYLFDGTKTACCILNDRSYARPEYEPKTLLARYKERRSPPECERCSFFAGYP